MISFQGNCSAVYEDEFGLYTLCGMVRNGVFFGLFFYCFFFFMGEASGNANKKSFRVN